MAERGYTIDDVCISFLEVCRFYAVMLSKMNKIVSKQVPTAGVGFNKLGKVCLYYNKEYLEALTLKEAQGLIEHEVLHVFWRHLIRFKFETTGTITSLYNNKANNLGCDCSINQYLKTLPEGGVYPKTFGLEEEKNADYYIAMLKEKFPQNKQNMSVCQTCQGTGKDPQQGQDQGKGKGKDKQDKQGQQGEGEGEGEGQDPQDQQGQGQGQQPQNGGEPCPDCGGSGCKGGDINDYNPLDSHDLWGKVVTDNDEVKDAGDYDIDPDFEVQQVVEKSVKECKDFGKLPSFVLKEIERLQKKKVNNWKKRLRVFVQSVLAVSKRLSQKRSNRRLAGHVDYEAPGKKKARKPSIVYARDTSGSMFEDKVQQEIANELYAISKFADVYVIDCDTKIHQEYRFKKASDIKPYKGGGGTAFEAVFERAMKLGTDGVIYATDTWGSFPDKKSIGKLANKTIWLTFNQPDVDIPFGKHVNIEPDKDEY